MEDDYVSYYTAAHAWPRGEKLTIVSALDTDIAAFPIAFLRQSGDDTWRYVSYVVSLLVVNEPDHPYQIVDSDANPVDLDSQPTAGTYRYMEVGARFLTELRFARGPEYLDPKVAPSGEIKDASDADEWSLNIPEQNDFRELLVARDSVCPVTGDRSLLCDVAHLVPPSRPDLYDRLTGSKFDIGRQESAILLYGNLHALYDSLMCSFYAKDSNYYFHLFTPQPSDIHLHGKMIPPTAFRAGFEPPNPQLLAWHYAQCVMARIRGFSSGMQLRDIDDGSYGSSVRAHM